jgi:MFS transporter, putative metabolite:H+ symporter
MENQVGFGKGQYALASTLALLLLSVGAQTMAQGLTLPILKQQWHLSTLQEAMGFMIMNIGMPLGSILQSLSDTFGRKVFIFIDLLIVTIFGLLSAIAWDFTSLVIFRFFYSIGVGILFPLFSCYATEVSPNSKKGTLVTALWIIFVGGYLLCCLLGYFLLPNSQWRLLIFLLCIPSILALVTYCFFQRESLHYLWSKGKAEEAHRMIN